MILYRHNEKLHSLCRSPNIVRVIRFRRLRWAGHVARMEEGRSALNILTDTAAGKRPRRRWENTIRIDIKEISINTRNWVDYAQYREYWWDLVNATLNLRVP